MSVVTGVRGCSAELTAEAVPCKTKKPGMQGGLGEWVPCFVCAMTAPLIDVYRPCFVGSSCRAPCRMPGVGPRTATVETQNAVILVEIG